MKQCKDIKEVECEVRDCLEIHGWHSGFVFESCPLVTLVECKVKKRAGKNPHIELALVFEYKTARHTIRCEKNAVYFPNSKVHVKEDIMLVEEQLSTKGVEVFSERFNRAKFEKYNCSDKGWHEADVKAATDKKRKRVDDGVKKRTTKAEKPTKRRATSDGRATKNKVKKEKAVKAVKKTRKKKASK